MVLGSIMNHVPFFQCFVLAMVHSLQQALEGHALSIMELPVYSRP